MLVMSSNAVTVRSKQALVEQLTLLIPMACERRPAAVTKVSDGLVYLG